MVALRPAYWAARQLVQAFGPQSYRRHVVNSTQAARFAKASHCLVQSNTTDLVNSASFIPCPCSSQIRIPASPHVADARIYARIGRESLCLFDRENYLQPNPPAST